jgi:hydroxyacylglutathione hydrolase
MEELLEGQPETPHYFSQMKARNRSGAAVLGRLPRPPRLTADKIAALGDSVQIVDVRSRHAYSGGHIPRSFAIPMSPSLSNWAGWMLSYDRPIVLIATEGEVEAVVTALIRVGLDTIVGYMDSVEQWVESDRGLARTRQIGVAEFLSNRNAYTVLDVRSQAEYADGHLDGAEHFFTGHLSQDADKVPHGQPLLVHCTTGYRSIIAASVLERVGIDDVTVLDGGYDALERVRLSPRR